jgi:GT2 family glycosyltransferase
LSALVSVVVPVYRGFHLVERSLPRILEGSRCELEIVVVNSDGCEPGRMRSWVDTLDDPRIRVLETDQPAGFSKAINTGIDATSGEFVFFANQDLFVADGYLDELVRFFERCPRAGCATGKVLRYDLEADRETDTIDTTGHTIGRNRRVVDRGENQKDEGQYAREEEVFGVSGAAFAARRKALESVKVRGEYVDEAFYLYKDDVDLSWRLRLAGWECWYVPSAVAFHARTSRGLGGIGYASAVRQFHANEKSKPRHVRMHSMKNQWLTLVKNEDLSNLARDLPYVLGREALVLGHNALFAPRDTAIALRRFVAALPGAVESRRVIKARQTTPPAQLRRWFEPASSR